MAGDWIKWLKGLGFRSEVLTVARKLAVHRGVVALACMEMWEWADSETIDGHVRGATAELIDAKVCLPGFSSALESVGWLKVKTEGITLPNFDRHNGKPAKLRAMKTKRQNNWRNDVDDSVDASVDAQVSTSASTREEKRREDVKTKPPLPPKGGVSAFDAFWTEYPRKKARGDAERAWKNRKCESVAPRVMAALEADKPEWVGIEPKYIPYPATWINGRRWEDDLPGLSIKPTDPRKAAAAAWLAAHKPEAAAMLRDFRRAVPIFANCPDEELTAKPPRELVDAVEARMKQEAA